MDKQASSSTSGVDWISQYQYQDTVYAVSSETHSHLSTSCKANLFSQTEHFMILRGNDGVRVGHTSAAIEISCAVRARLPLQWFYFLF